MTDLAAMEAAADVADSEAPSWILATAHMPRWVRDYMRSLNPTTVRALIAELWAAEATAEHWRQLVEETTCDCGHPAGHLSTCPYLAIVREATR